LIATIFQSQRTTSKIPISPTGDKKFQFEIKQCKNIEEVFFYLSRNFFLNIPLTKNVKAYKRKETLQELFVKKLDYVVVDFDGITKISDRNICVNFLKDYKCILAESRNPLNIKGILEVDNLTPKETKIALKETFGHLPCVVDTSVCHYASYQAPILKENILFQGGEFKLKKVKTKPKNVSAVIIPSNIQDICKNMFMQKGFVFYENNGTYKCSHYSEKKSPRGFSWNPAFPFRMSHWNQDRAVDIWNEVIKTPEYKDFQKEESKRKIKDLLKQQKGTITTKYLGDEKEKVQQFLDSYKILKIQSPMGTAKSTIIDEVLNQAHKRELRVLLITNRISLADDISKKYKNIKHYQNSELNEDYQIGDNLVCQVNSLWKYSLKYFDVVIIDEVTSLLFQLFNIEYKAKNIITKVFATKNKKIVLADAFIFDDFIKLFGDSVLNITNNYREDTQLMLYSQLDNWVYNILKSAKNGVITVSSGSIKMIKILELLLKQQNISYYSITSETTKTEKELVYKEFTKKHQNGE
jgi:hypothetical protein